MMKLGERMRRILDMRGISQKEFSDLVRMKESKVSKILNDTQQIKSDELVSFADALGMSLDDLVGRNIPEWATQDDVFALDEMLESNVTMAYGGENLTEEEKQRVKDILTAIFWEKLQKRK